MMGEAPPPFEFTGPEVGHRHSAESLSDLNGTQPHHHFHPPSHQSSDWRPQTIDEFNAWNASPQGMFPSSLISPGHNPDQLPHPESRHPACAERAPADNANPRKRKQTTKLGSSVGGYGPMSPETSTETGPLNPSPPQSNSKQRRNAAYDVWAFARPLVSDEEPPTDQWPTSSEQHLTEKPKTAWFGCKLCSQFGYTIYLSAWEISY